MGMKSSHAWPHVRHFSYSKARSAPRPVARFPLRDAMGLPSLALVTTRECGHSIDTAADKASTLRPGSFGESAPTSHFTRPPRRGSPPRESPGGGRGVETHAALFGGGAPSEAR